MFTRRFEYTFFEYFKNFERKMLAKPLNLGGTSGTGGGAGGPPGGFIGYLPQTRVTYDTSEIASSGIPVSGQSLLDNLNHIRYRIESLEQYGVTSVYEDDVLVASGVTILNFEGNVDVTNDGGGQVTVTVISGVPTDELVKVSSNDTVASYLESKISAGSNVTVSVLNEGGNEELQISAAGSGLGTDELVKVNGSDTTAGYLEDKLTAGSGITISTIDEQIQIDATGLAGLVPNTILYANESGEVTTSGLLQYFNADTYQGDPADGYFFPHLIIGYQGEDYKEYEYWDYMPFGVSNISVYTAGNSQPVTDNDYGISIVCTREESYYGNQARLAFWSAQGDLINPEALANQAKAGIIEFNGWNSYNGWWQGLANITVSTDGALTGDNTARGVMEFNVDQYGGGTYTSQMQIDRYGVQTLQSLFVSGWYKRGSALVNTFPYTISDTQYGPNIFYLSNYSAYTVYLPTASTAAYRVYTFKKITNNGYAMTIDGHDSETIDGATTYVLSAYNESVTLACNGTEWYVLNSYTP